MESESKRLELRIPGIGGPSPESVLGCAPGTSVVAWQSEPSARSTVRSAPGETGTVAYDWRPLTSGSRSFVVWPLLLPFTIANLAGFMGPAGRAWWYRTASVLFGLVMTASTVVWLFVAAVAGWRDVDIPVLVVEEASSAFWLAVVSTVIVMAALVLAATYAADGFERYRSRSRTGETARWRWPWGASSGRDLDDGDFFHNGKDHAVRWRIHVSVSVLVGAALVASIIITDGVADPEGVLNDAVAAMAVVTSVSVALLVAGSVFDRRRWGWRLAGPAVAVLAAVLLGGVVLSVLIATGGVSAVPAGPVAMLYDVFGWSLLAGLFTAVAVTVFGLQTPSPPETHRQSANFVSTLSARLRARLAVVPAQMAVAAAAFATAFAVGSPIAIVVRWLPDDRDEWTLTATLPVDIARYAFLFLIGFMFLNAAKTWGDPKSLRRVGSVWDVISFWPRTYHPFAVRSYAERAVPELDEYIFGAPGRPPVRPLSVVAHSQGSVLAYAAVRPHVIGADESATVAARFDGLRLVTVGSPLRSLYCAAFPRYVDETELAEMGGGGEQPGDTLSVLDWTNGFRFTDHVGRAVFSSDAVVASGDGSATDRAIAEGASAVMPDQVEGHNRYWNLPEVIELARLGRRWHNKEEPND